MTVAVQAALAAYNLAWKGVMPLLKFNSRLEDGWGQRTLSGELPAPADLWIQAASGGEAYLAWEVLKNMTVANGRSLRVIATTNTRQGFETLQRAADDVNGRKVGLAVQPWHFPFDAPSLMKRAVKRVNPKCALILETEIWPGFLSACRKAGTKILLANGRMTAKSLGGYMAWPGLFRALAPDRVMAVSETDGHRFATLFGRHRVTTMPNIKFDRMAGAGPMARKDNPLREAVAPKREFVVLGSVRKQEADAVCALTGDLLRVRPGIAVGLFPRHMHHVELWTKRLDAVGLRWTLRSKMQGTVGPGEVIVWDAFGELVPAYGLASAAFVGGSLAPLGGQNFLEPLTCGVVPVIGPHWSNFAWAGREAFDSGLVVEARDAADAAAAVVRILKDKPARKGVAAKARAYIRDRSGGAEATAKQVAHFLDSV